MSKYECMISDSCLSCSQPGHTVAAHVWNEDKSQFGCIIEGCDCKDFTPPQRSKLVDHSGDQLPYFYRR